MYIITAKSINHGGQIYLTSHKFIADMWHANWISDRKLCLKMNKEIASQVYANALVHSKHSNVKMIHETGDGPTELTDAYDRAMGVI